MQVEKMEVEKEKMEAEKMQVEKKQRAPEEGQAIAGFIEQTYIASQDTIENWKGKIIISSCGSL